MSTARKYKERTPDAKRRAALAKVHCGKRDLRLDDDTYRDLLRQKTGKDSARDLDEAELGIVLDEMRKRGFRRQLRNLISDRVSRRNVSRRPSGTTWASWAPWTIRLNAG